MDCPSVADTMANLRDFILDGQDEVGDFEMSVLIIPRYYLGSAFEWRRGKVKSIDKLQSFQLLQQIN